jgi:hypothetical protein
VQLTVRVLWWMSLLLLLLQLVLGQLPSPLPVKKEEQWFALVWGDITEVNVMDPVSVP